MTMLKRICIIAGIIAYIAIANHIVTELYYDDEPHHLEITIEIPTEPETP